jgi:hypothetical protein
LLRLYEKRYVVEKRLTMRAQRAASLREYGLRPSCARNDFSCFVVGAAHGRLYEKCNLVIAKVPGKVAPQIFATQDARGVLTQAWLHSGDTVMPAP